MSSSVTNFYQLVVIVLSELQTLVNSQIFVLRAELEHSKYSKTQEQILCSPPIEPERDSLDINGYLFSLLIPRSILKECRN